MTVFVSGLSPSEGQQSKTIHQFSADGLLNYDLFLGQGVPRIELLIEMGKCSQLP